VEKKMQHLAVDLGSESGRVVAGNIESGKLKMATIHRFKTQSFRTNLHRFRDLYRFYEEILHSFRIFREKHGPNLGSFGVDSWGSDIVLVNRIGNIDNLPLFYREYGHFDIERIVEDAIGWDSLYDRTGNQKLSGDTLHQLIFMKHHRDPCLDDPKAMLFISDVFHYLLGANLCCEHSMISDSHIYNNNNGDWDKDVFAAFDLPGGLITPICYAGDHIGDINEQILEEVGLNQPVKIITPAGHDTASAALAVPDFGDDWIFISSGTWSLMGLQTDAPVITERTKRYYFDNSGIPFGKNMIRKNITGMWILQQCAEKWIGVSYDEIAQRAEVSESIDYYIDVDEPDFSLSTNMPLTICRKLKSQYNVDIDPNDVGVVARIFFESLALKYRFVLERLLDSTGRKINKIHIIGGGGKNTILNKYTANVTGYRVISGVYEATAVGNLLMQAYGCKEVGSMDEIRQTIRDTFPLEYFDPADTERWEQKYKRFRESLDLR
jgi:rhamnulokinase